MPMKKDVSSQNNLAMNIASMFIEHDGKYSSLRVSDPGDRENTWAGIVLVGDVTCRKATFADVMWILQRVAMEAMSAKGSTVTPEAMNAAAAPHMLRDEDLLDHFATLRAAGHENEAQELWKELLDRLNGFRSR